MRVYRSSGLGALGRGLIAGAVGAAVQSLYLRATKKIAPSSPPDIFVPPELAQLSEPASESVARRFSEQFLQRGPITLRQKRIEGKIVHLAFGATAGGLYGLFRESFRPARGLLGALTAGTIAWAIKNSVLLPVFRLAASPQRYPLKVHAYTFGAHMAYALGLYAAYELEHPRTLKVLDALLFAAKSERRTRKIPRALRPAARRVVRAAARARAQQPIVYAPRDMVL